MDDDDASAVRLVAYEVRVLKDDRTAVRGIKRLASMADVCDGDEAGEEQLRKARIESDERTSRRAHGGCGMAGWRKMSGEVLCMC